MSERQVGPAPGRSTRQRRVVLPHGELHVWRLDLSRAVDDADLLSAAERARASRFVRAVDERHFVVCRVAVRMIAAAYLGSDPSAIGFEEAGEGRPRLSGAGEHLEMSWSRSGHVGLVAVAQPGITVGVDVEIIRRVPEQSFLRLEFGDALASDRELLQAWTRLEAALKAMGAGLAGLSRADGTQFAGSDRERIVMVGDVDLRVSDIPVGFGSVGAVAAISPRPVRVLRRSWPG